MFLKMQIAGGLVGMVVGVAIVMGTAVLLRLPLGLGF